MDVDNPSETCPQCPSKDEIIEDLYTALSKLVKGVEDWNDAVRKIIPDMPPKDFDGMEYARAALKKAKGQ